MSMPWSKFFWTDYDADPALKLCSFAAQGLWMRMMCIAAAHDPAGYVAVNGRGLDAQGIARIAGGSVEEIETLLHELAHNNVYSKDRRGWIYSRRMINDAKKHRKSVESGKKGGNPMLRKQREKSDTLKGEVEEQLKPQKPEARSQSSEDKSSDAEASQIVIPDQPEKPPPPIDPIKQLFDTGVALLTGAGKTESQARSLIGKWRKDRTDGEVLTALIECKTRMISEPVEWLTKRLKTYRYVSPSGYEYRGDIDDVIRESEKRADWSTHWKAKGDLQREREGAAADA